MTVKITYFVHGTTVDNENEISSGWSDCGLSALGIKQAEELRQQTQHQTFDIVFASDQKRAVDSAKITWGNKYKIIHDKRLRECNYGDFNGKPSSVVEPLQEESINNAFENGESYEHVKKRIAEFLKYLTENYDGQHVAIVAHKAPQIALDVLLRDMTWEEAFATDWRKTHAWQPGWEYQLD